MTPDDDPDRAARLEQARQAGEAFEALLAGNPQLRADVEQAMQKLRTGRVAREFRRMIAMQKLRRMSRAGIDPQHN
jgi:hypothetical protein